ncbi:MAG: ribonuclease H [Chloroflexota bacterium]
MLEVTIYTDGGCAPNPGLGGYAAILQCGDNERVIKGAVPGTTNYRMELMAVLRGLEALTQPCKVTVISDSNNVVQGGNEWITGWIANGWRNSRNKAIEHDDLWKQIHALMAVHDVTFVKVKAHVSQTNANHAEKMNIRVDALVAEARAEYTPPVSTTPNYRLFIAGSRLANDNMITYAHQWVNHAIENSWTIVVGDNAKGIDKAVVDYLNERVYTNAIVVGIARSPRNGGVSGGQYIRYGQDYTSRDQGMARASNHGVFIWSGDEHNSPGTKKGWDYMRSLPDRTVHLMNFRHTFN